MQKKIIIIGGGIGGAATALALYREGFEPMYQPWDRERVQHWKMLL